MNDAISVPAPTQDEKTMAMLAHILQIFTWWIGPLVIFLVKQDSKFVRFHALQALLWQITLMVLGMIGVCLWFAVILSTVFSSVGRATVPNQAPPIAVFAGIGIVWLGFIVIYFSNILLGIVFGIKAGHGEWASYPLLGRWARSIVKA
jgi:uncharacterized Tic20 family protein